MLKAATVEHDGPFGEGDGRRMGRELFMKLGQAPQACWLFCSPKDGFELLVSGVSEVVGPDKLAGCTTDGEISPFGVGSKSAVLIGIVSESLEFEFVFVENAGKRSGKAGEMLAEKFSGPVDHVQLFSDGLTTNGCELLQGIQSVLGKEVPVSGGAAGDDGRFVRTWQFIGSKVKTDAVVAVGIRGNFKVGQGVHSGWVPVGLAKKVTKVKGNVLYELNNESALKVYERFLGKHSDKLPSVGVEYPLGLIDKCWLIGECKYYLLRATMAVDRKAGSISFAGNLPEGAMVRLTCADKASILNAADKATDMALEQLGGTPPVLAFVCSCMARKNVLGRETFKELDKIREKIGKNIPMAGFYTYGEFSPVRRGGTCFLHNETIAVSLLGGFS